MQKRREDDARLQVLPRLDGASLDDAVDGRLHVRVGEIELRDVHALFRRGDVGFRGRDGCLVRLDLFARDEPRVRGGRSLTARDLGLGLRLRRRRLVDPRFRLIDGDLVTRAFDRRERLPLLHRLPFGEVHAVDGAGDASGHLHLLERLNHPGRRDDVVELPEIDRGDFDGEGEPAPPLPLRARPRAPGRRRPLRAGRPPEHERCARERRRQNENRACHRSSVPIGSSPIACLSAK